MAIALVTDDKVAGRERLRATFGAYYPTPVYRKFLAWAGHGEAAAAIAGGWAAKGRTKTAAAISGHMIDQIGTANEVRERIRADVNAGVHMQIITPVGVTPEDTRRTLSDFTRDQFTPQMGQCFHAAKPDPSEREREKRRRRHKRKRDTRIRADDPPPLLSSWARARDPI